MYRFVIAGEQSWPSCTPPYAPPEVALPALDGGGRQVVVQPSHDMWALGVMAYEALTQTRALTLQRQVVQCAHGDEAYPWEAPVKQQHPAWRGSRLRPILEPCLSRDAAARPSAEATLKAVSRLGHSTTVRW